MELPSKSGIEPDYCFKIDNWAAVAGKKRINWSIDPPPDLVLEVDVTSYTDVNDYLPYQVPEVWLALRRPDVNLQAVIASCLRTAYERNTSAAIRSLRRVPPPLGGSDNVSKCGQGYTNSAIRSV